MQPLETERLVLRMLREADLDGYADMFADAEVMRFLGGKPLTRAEAWRNLAMVLGHWQLRGYGFFAVEERATGEFVGRIGPWRPEGWPGLEVGWALRRRYWGKGYATEAASASLSYAFRELGPDRVISLIHPENAGSIRVARRLGQQPVGHAEILGVPVVVHAINRNEWQKQSQISNHHNEK